MKKILKNLLIAIGIIIYFIILVLAYTKINTGRLSNYIKAFAGTFLILGLIALEKAYKKDSGKIAIIGIELLVLSFHSLSIMHMVNVFKCDFNFYLIISSAIVASYYLVKGIAIYTKERREYLKGLSDISEIVKKDEPIKKEARKRNSVKSEKTKEIVNNKQKENIEIKKEVNPKKKTATKKRTTQAKKATSTKKAGTGSKKVGTKKTKQPEEKSEEKVQTKSKTTKKTIKVNETTKEDKPEIEKKKTSARSTTTKRKTTKSKKEVKEND